MATPHHIVIDDDTPGRMLTIQDLTVGSSVTQTFAFDDAARQAFIRLANDRAPVHDDQNFALDKGFDGRIIQGLCVVSRFSRLIGMYLPGEAAILESISFKYRRPVYQDLTLRYRVEVKRVLVPLKVVRLRMSVNCSDTVCVTGEAQCLVR